MNKQFLFSLITVCSFTAYSMEESKSAKATTPAQERSSITICSSIQKHVTDFNDITPQTTVSELKNKLQESEGIPVDQQTLRTKTAWLFGLYNTYSQPLSNGTLVTNAMKEYQTNKFSLSLHLRKPSRS